ncbi:MAG: HAD hydrolase-like protein [Proteobacteria bacterium]|nr:HAD hydrolase-like protein [Pseudomonadota bacterium]
MLLSEERASERLDADWVCRRYEEIRARLPMARFPATSRRIGNLGDLSGEIDVFVLDGYGVLNVGTRVVPGAPERVAALRAAGKRLFVLTNGASYPAARTLLRYRRLGFDFTAGEVVSSRDALARALAGRQELRWGFAAVEASAIGELAQAGVRLGDDPADYDAVDGFVLLSTGDWNRARQDLLLASLRARPRPVLVGNPDLVSPREDGLAAEPGLYAHEIADLTGCAPEFYGKPFANVFELVRERIGAGPDSGVPPHRIAMAGDTLHTDILGGACMGWRTVLVLDHGLLKGFAAGSLDRLSDIRPDFIADTT